MRSSNARAAGSSALLLQLPVSAHAPPQGARGGSGRLCTPRGGERPGHRPAGRHCLFSWREPPLRLPTRLLFWPPRREEEARANWLALRAEAKRRKSLGLPASIGGVWGF